MAGSSKHVASLAGVAILAVALHTAPASAQQAKYCSNALVANSFYSNVLQAQGGADVEYHGQFQNLDPQRRTLVATMLRVTRVGLFTTLRPVRQIELQSYQQKDVMVLAVHTDTRSGQGAPTPATVGQTIRFSCTFQ